jgi:hypothetical protein
MRSVLALLFIGFAGCLAGTLDANSRPAVIPKLSELPEDHAQRDAVLDQSHETAGPEQRKGMTKKERKIETAAALAAALIGDAFSSDHNVTIGLSTDTDPVKPAHIHVDGEPTEPAGQGSGSATPVVVQPPSGDLLPWVKLK